MDIKNRVMGDMPQDFLHKIAGIIPGYEGYMDRERRRDADKILRTGLARQYSAQRDRLNRVQHGLVRSHQMESIAEVDRLVGVLQRFIDRLSTATYGYAGLFDPIKVESSDLDQLYTFDMALASGVDQVASAIDTLEMASTATPASGEGSAKLAEMPAAVTRLSSVVDELNQRLNQRADLLTTGKRLPDDDYRAMLSSLDEKSAPAVPPAGGEQARYAGGQGTGTPTTDLRSSGIQTASSPVAGQGAPARDVVEGTASSMSGDAISIPDTLKPLGNQDATAK